MKLRNGIILFSNWLLKKIYDAEVCGEIEGDLLELYNSRPEAKGKTKASLLYLWDAVLSFRNIGLRKKRKSFNRFPINPIAMLGNISRSLFAV
jgi:hypothetical protein